MNTHLVYLSSDSGVIPEKFPDSNHRIAEGLWAVGSTDSTSADMMTRLGIGQQLPGVNVKVDSHYGHFDQALWQKINAWVHKR